MTSFFLLLLLSTALSLPLSLPLCPRLDCPNRPTCAPRRCCGDRTHPVLGGIDLVDLLHGGGSATPVIGTVPAYLGGYRFLFRNDSNALLFLQSPTLYIPQAGGFCAFSMTGYDPNGIGLWCACNGHPEGYAIVDGKIYFFLFELARSQFLSHSDSVVRMEKQWQILLRENGSSDDFHCFNTQRLVPTKAMRGGDSSSCHMMDCMRFINCSDCSQHNQG